MTVASTVIVTSGEPAGIGVDLCIDALAQEHPRQLVVIGDTEVFKKRARKRGVSFEVDDYLRTPAAKRCIWHCPTNSHVKVGKPSPDTAAYVMLQLRRATEGCLSGKFSALVTAPINKDMICQSGISFSGHTEYLAKSAKVKRPIMLIAGPVLRVALATRHLPLRKVPAALSEEGLFQDIKTLNDGLKKRLGITKPKIKVAGLNPHAGEGGFLGNEEIRIIQPAIKRAQKAKILAEGPFPADTMFMETADAFLVMYHDQGLPVVKFADFDNTVNVTLGLPFFRVSPAHGTAASLAGMPGVRFGSMRTALAMAMRHR